MDRSPVRSKTMKKAAQKRKSSALKKKNQPLRVVYISNPMRVQTSASGFRALVQELTGRDAEFPEPAKFHDRVVASVEKKRESEDDDLGSTVQDSSENSSYESFEEMLMREMMMMDVKIQVLRIKI